MIQDDVQIKETGEYLSIKIKSMSAAEYKKGKFLLWFFMANEVVVFILFPISAIFLKYLTDITFFNDFPIFMLVISAVVFPFIAYKSINKLIYMTKVFVVFEVKSESVSIYEECDNKKEFKRKLDKKEINGLVVKKKGLGHYKLCFVDKQKKEVQICSDYPLGTLEQIKHKIQEKLIIA